MMAAPRASAEFIVKNAKHVTINLEKVKELAEMLSMVFLTNKYNAKVWKAHELHPKEMTDATLNWIFVADTLNFSFWGENNKKHGVAYKGKTYTGYWSLHAAIRRALDPVPVNVEPTAKPKLAGIPILSAEYYASVSKEDFSHLLRSDTETVFPLIDERYSVLQEAGKVLLSKYNGSFVNCVKQCNNSAMKLVELLVNDFPSYKDESELDGKKVYFYKRAQILTGDIWSCFEGKGYGRFEDIDALTIFADYRLPQVLVYFGLLEYSEALNKKLKADELFSNGERQEVEIRGCTIAAVELLKDQVKSILASKESNEEIVVNSCLLDYYLWDFRQDHATSLESVPFHKVRCIYY